MIICGSMLAVILIGVAATAASDMTGPNDKVARNLQGGTYEMIQSYQPKTLVTDNNAIDLDLAAIQDQFELGTKVGMEVAEKIYREGAFSHPVAKLTLDSPLTEDVPRGTRVTGVAFSTQGQMIEGRTRDFWPKDATEVFVEYSIGVDQATYSECQVGGNPSPNFHGCFIDSGLVSVPEFQLSLRYTYDPRNDNFLFRAFEGFSIYAKEFMAECGGNCPYSEFQKFTKYYDVPDYADKLISAAFSGGSTLMLNGNMDFALFGDAARADYVKRSLVVMNLWMWVIRQLNFAIDICEGKVDCPPADEFCDESPGLHAWDRAVAYYTGSLHSSPGSTNGNLLFDLANEECTQFKTCSGSGTSVNGDANVNIEIFENFRGGQSRIREGDCYSARKLKESIVQLMTVPLVQGTLRYAHLLAREKEYWEPYGANGAAFASSMLPLVHFCDPAAAQVIHDNLRAQHLPNVDFFAVKRALERNYPCLKVSCHQIGGIYNPFDGGYLDGAEPCTEIFGQITVDLDDNSKAMAIGLTIAVITLFVLGIVVCLIRRAAEKRIQLKHQQLEGQQEPKAEIL